MRSLTSLGRAVPLVLFGVAAAQGACKSSVTDGAGGGGGGGGLASTSGKGSSSASTASGAPCKPGETMPCYTGAPETENIGACRDGVAKCAGGVFGACEGDVTPTTETCDGLDNNCDGMIDEGCSCTDGAMQSCYTGPAGTAGVGVCQTGMQTCVDGKWQQSCAGEVVPSNEICNGKDDNCDGKVDEGDPQGGGGCSTGKGGACDGGTQHCQNGVLVCDADAQGTSCNTGKPGICAAGSYDCSGASTSCAQKNQPTAEKCNGLDDDCDGVVDNTLGSACNTGQPGQCAAGTVQCDGNQNFVCVSTQGPTPEICDGIDNDCNGLVDDGICCGCSCGCCPYVYAYDGERYVYETSVGGGALHGRARHLTEGKEIDYSLMWARLDSARVLSGGDGGGEVRAKLLAAEDEIVYFDHAFLTIVEHPEGTEVLTSTSINWRTLKKRDPKEFFALRTSAMRAPSRASWRGEIDVTDAIGERDDRAVHCDPSRDNFYELDFGEVKDARHAKLVVDGWKLKQKRRLAPGVAERRPRIEVRGADGVFREAMEIAPPRGDRKTVAFDLSSIEWPEGRCVLRMYTGTHEGGTSMWYVDRVRLIEEAPADVRVRHVRARSAELTFRGAPTMLDEANLARPRLNVDDGGGAAPSPHVHGRFTRYGDVRELLDAPDDRCVVMRQGDQVELVFGGVGEASSGSARTFFLATEVLFKRRVSVESGRANELTSSVGPLPFHGMGRYPYALEAAPKSDAYRRYLTNYNTREVFPRHARRAARPRRVSARAA